jgi:hypothetical protein
MHLRLNENEVVDGICVFMANSYHVSPEHVDVKELNFHKDEHFSSKAAVNGNTRELETEEIILGVKQFLEEFHSFDTDRMSVKLQFDKKHGVTADVLVNED